MAPVKIFYKGESRDFILFAESEEAYNEYQTDSSVPLSRVVADYQVFTPENGRGSEGRLAEASHLDLENEFGTKVSEEVALKILKGGESKHETATVGRKSYSSTNDSNGA